MDLPCWPVGGRGDAVQFVNPPNLKMNKARESLSQMTLLTLVPSRLLVGGANIQSVTTIHFLLLAFSQHKKFLLARQHHI